MANNAFSVEQLAKRWGMTPKSVYAMIHSGRLPAFKPGGKLFRIQASEVARFEGLTEEQLAASMDHSGQGEDVAPMPSLDAAPQEALDVRRLPGWPLTMSQSIAAAYLDLPLTSFERAVATGRLPRPINLGGELRWKRSAIDVAIQAL